MRGRNLDKIVVGCKKEIWDNSGEEGTESEQIHRDCFENEWIIMMKPINIGGSGILFLPLEWRWMIVDKKM